MALRLVRSNHKRHATTALPEKFDRVPLRARRAVDEILKRIQWLQQRYGQRTNDKAKEQ